MQKIMLIFFGAAFFCCSSTDAFADDVLKSGVMTCAPSTNKVLIRMGVFYSWKDAEFPAYLFPKKFEKDFGPMNKLHSEATCQLSNGKKISFSHSEGQSFAYGWNGGDAPAYITLKVGDDYIFYKYSWYAGFQPDLDKNVAYLLKDASLYECKSDDAKIYDLNVSAINVNKCSDISHRMKGNLSVQEKNIIRRDDMISSYQPIDIDHSVCSYFKDNENILSLLRAERGMFNEIPPEYGGRRGKKDIDINNDGKLEAVYRFMSYDHYFDGSYFVYADNIETQNKVSKCLLEYDCPTSIEKDVLQNRIENLVETLGKTFSGAHVVSANSLKPDIGPEYEVRYTSLFPVVLNDRTYIYFKPLIKETLPRGVVAEIDKNNELKIICTLKDIPKW